MCAMELRFAALLLLQTQRRFPACALETGIIAFALGAESIDSLKVEAVAVNGKSVVVRKRQIFGAAPFFSAVVPVFVITGANTGFGLTEGTAVFLTQSAVSIVGFAIAVHCEARLADGSA